MALSKSEIMERAAGSLAVMTVEIPLLGTVLIKPLNVRGRKEWLRTFTSPDGKMDPERAIDSTTKIAARSLVNADGTQMFSEAEFDELSPEIADGIIAQVLKVNKIGKNAVAEEVKN